MAKFKPGDMVVWKSRSKEPVYIYSIVDKILNLLGSDEAYYICFIDKLCNGKKYRETYEFWEHELELVDMKGANI